MEEEKKVRAASEEGGRVEKEEVEEVKKENEEEEMDDLWVPLDLSGVTGWLGSLSEHNGRREWVDSGEDPFAVHPESDGAMERCPGHSSTRCD